MPNMAKTVAAAECDLLHAVQLQPSRNRCHTFQMLDSKRVLRIGDSRDHAHVPKNAPCMICNNIWVQNKHSMQEKYGTNLHGFNVNKSDVCATVIRRTKWQGKNVGQTVMLLCILISLCCTNGRFR
eukprot:6196586-Pleurochrysis_carterae.AAC.6